jgi:hypothetical protein
MVPAAIAQTAYENTKGASAVQTSEEILTELRAMDGNKLCQGQTGRLRGKCITDIIKRLKMLRGEFTDALEIERTAWYNVHSYLGVSDEYKKQLYAYLKLVNDKHKTFNDLQRALEKIFFAEQKAVRTNANSSSSSSRGFTRSVSKTGMSDASLKCSKVKDDSAKRICLRGQLRLNDPAARQMGASRRTNKSQ